MAEHFTSENGQEHAHVIQEGALAGYRVLDLTDVHGWMCGKVLADLGAIVIKIEPPGGDPGRQRGPFYHDHLDPENSLSWFAFNTGKRSLCLDLTRSHGQELLRQLVRGADFVLESFRPGILDGLGLGYGALKAVNRRIILTSITPFGQDGPYHAWHGSDIVCMAMGGLMGLTGEANGRPVRLSLPQAALHAGVEAAVASLLAHHWRAYSGEGQHIDVSMQACVVWTLMAAPGFVPCLGTMPTRGGPCYNWFGYPRRLNFPCADGAVALYLVGGLAGGRSMQALTRLMQAEGLALGWMLEQDWTTWSLSRRGAQGQAESEQLDQTVLAYTCSKTKQELYDLALQHRILLAPVSNVGDLYHNTQLQARQFFVPVHHPALNTCFGYPGAFARFSRTPCLPPRPAPLIGEHTGQILFEELGVDDRTLETLAADGVIACRSPRATPSTVPVPPRPEPPAATTTPPARPLEGIRVLDFTWVAVGPITTRYLADHGAMAGMLGFYELTGWSDGEPCAIYGAYTDFIAPRFAALAALDSRRRTGKGQYIDLAQSEASLHFLAPALLDYTANGHIMQRQGNRDPSMAPHGAYRCQGDDRWCVIAVDTEDAWQRLCTVAGHAEWAHDLRFATLAARLHHADALDALLQSWTCTHNATQLVQRLQAAGVAAGVVQNMRELRDDPQLQHRGFWAELDHGEIGRVAIEGQQFRFSRLPTGPRQARPGIGEHTGYVLGEILGLSAAEIARLQAAEIVY